MIRLTFLAHSLQVGGAEVQLSNLVRGLDRSVFAPTLVSFYDEGPLLGDIRAAGIPVVTAGKSGRGDVIGFYRRIVRAIRGSRPDIIYSYLDFPNVIAALARPPGGRTRVVWGVRASDMRLADRDITWRLNFRLERLLVRRVSLIICNAAAGQRHLVANGFPEEKTTVIANGIDTERFAPDAATRTRVRQELGVGEDELLIGLVARLDPMKDHPTFLHAAAQLAAGRPGVRFVCVGGGAPDYVRQMQALGQTLGLADRIIWTGARSDVPAVMNALDISTLSSAYGEGFPNVVGEAMACGVPCVVTDVGDAAVVVACSDMVVPRQDPDAMAAAWDRLAGLPAATLSERGAEARAHIRTTFPNRRMIERSAAALAGLVNGPDSDGGRT